MALQITNAKEVLSPRELSLSGSVPLTKEKEQAIPHPCEYRQRYGEAQEPREEKASSCSNPEVGLSNQYEDKRREYRKHAGSRMEKGQLLVETIEIGQDHEQAIAEACDRSCSKQDDRKEQQE